MNHRRITLLIMLIPLALCVWLAPLAAQELSLAKQVTERILPNGLKVLMVQRPDYPTVRCILAYRVGSVNERPGITGISHMHEHMMFKGTRTMGIKPGTFEKDAEYNRQIDELEAQVVAEEAKLKGADEATTKAIEEKIIALKKEASDLIAKQREETIVSEEIWSAYQEAGGTGINASTGQEMTQYYVTLPKNKIELFLSLEADRMANPVFREFYAERDVLVEERRMSENRPGFFFNEQLNATFYGASPYAWSVVGWMSDLSRITKQEVIDYRNQYYRPDNAVLVLAGALDIEPTMALVTKWFGPIESKGPSPRVRTEEPSPESYRKFNGPDFQVPYIEKRVYGRAATNPYVEVMFHIPPLWHKDLAPLYMLGQVMSSRTGKMYQDMVLKNDHATSVNASASNSEYDGEFSFRATAKENRNNTTVVPMDQLEKELWTFIEDAKTTPCNDELLQREKNQVEASFLRSLAGTGIASSLARMEVGYKWQFLDEQFKQRMAVTPEDMMRVAKIYFTRDNSVTGVLERER